MADNPTDPRPAAAPPPDVRVRPAGEADLPEINAIYNHYVARSVCTYQEEPTAAAERAEWFARHGPRHPVTVAVDAGGVILGWGSLSPFHPRSAYRFTVENSVYLRHDVHGRGIGRLLLEDLIARARQLGHHSIVALVDAEQTASIALHRKLGFAEVGRLRSAGFKFDRWLDVVYLQKVLSAEC